MNLPLDWLALSLIVFGSLMLIGLLGMCYQFYTHIKGQMLEDRKRFPPERKDMQPPLHRPPAGLDLRNGTWRGRFSTEERKHPK